MIRKFEKNDINGVNNNYIEGIFVDTNNQRYGIGTSLLNKVKENRNNLTLSVYKKNRNAIDFYKKNADYKLSIFKDIYQ